jgi:fatty-acyl-CoA synthase
LQAWLAARIAKFKVPKTVVFVDALPRTETGKIARAQCRVRWGDVKPTAKAEGVVCV